MENNVWLMQGDCLERMKEISDGSVDMILCDLPYGTTQNKWDAIIPFEALWDQYKRILKGNGVVVLTASQPFSSFAVLSNIDWFKYDWVWKKEKGTGHLNAKKMPMKDKEDILVFYNSTPTYNPQMTEGTPYSGSKGRNPKKQTSSYGGYQPIASDNNGTRYPKQVLEFNTVGRGSVHPTQKPVALMEYLIKTYTNEGETVLDNCMGSGTTGVACKNLSRKFIGIEKDEQYFNIAEKRINGEEQKVA